ncbi:unnamed protein product [Miscanthus lutarioriparius]|uniref:Uncharacterized protein n=1 Tax=Miscanthus lutarioriparius TaxID=422564 RepID=A0A811MWG5_9POAL|nr:unnamed protein product [Miscanthus lutarioriparius]
MAPRAVQALLTATSLLSSPPSSSAPSFHPSPARLPGVHCPRTRPRLPRQSRVSPPGPSSPALRGRRGFTGSGPDPGSRADAAPPPAPAEPAASDGEAINTGGT